MHDSYIEWKNNLNRKIRKMQRGKRKEKKLELPEVLEEEYENL